MKYLPFWGSNGWGIGKGSIKKIKFYYNCNILPDLNRFLTKEAKLIVVRHLKILYLGLQVEKSTEK